MDLGDAVFRRKNWYDFCSLLDVRVEEETQI